MSCHALWPGGFLNVEPPVRLLIGWVASRELGDLVHFGGDDRGIAAFASKQRLREDVIVRRAAMPIAVVQIGVAEHVNDATSIDRARFDKRVLGFASIGTAVHAQRAADSAGNAAHERQPGNAGLLRGARYLDIGDRCAGAHGNALDHNVTETTAKPDDNARNATVAHDEIRTKADDDDGDLGWQMGQEITEIGFVLGHEQNLRRAANAKPGELCERLVAKQSAAQTRRVLFDDGNEVGNIHPVTLPPPILLGARRPIG